MTKYLSPEQYLPHDPPMVLIDEVVDICEDCATCISYVKEDGVLGQFLDENKDLDSFYAIELLAQAIGIWSGFWNKQNTSIGMLLSGRKFTCSSSKFSYGSKLKIYVKKEYQADELAAFIGTITTDETILSTGSLKVMSVPSDKLDMLFKRD